MTVNNQYLLQGPNDRYAWSELHEAIHDNRPDLVKTLCNGREANVHVSDTLGLTPLHWACAYGRPEIVRILLEAGADPTRANYAGDLPMKYTHDKFVRKQCMASHVECAHLLFKAQGCKCSQALNGRTLREYFAPVFEHEGVEEALALCDRQEKSEEVATAIGDVFADFPDLPPSSPNGSPGKGRPIL